MKHLRLKTLRHLAFTFTELMVTLLIVGILTAVATASYNFYISKTRLAEAYTTIDIISKSEATYYLSNKRFVSFFVPVKQDYLVPSSGDKIEVDSSKPSSSDLTSGATSTQAWDAIGKPIPNASMIGFFYWSAAGKNDGAGQPAASSPPFEFYNGHSTAPILPIVAVSNPVGSTVASCVLNLGQDIFAANNGVADKSWVVINAFANFDNSLTDTDSHYSSQGLCTRIYKNLEISSNGNIIGGNPIATENLGH